MVKIYNFVKPGIPAKDGSCLNPTYIPNAEFPRTFTVYRTKNIPACLDLDISADKPLSAACTCGDYPCAAGSTCRRKSDNNLLVCDTGQDASNKDALVRQALGEPRIYKFEAGNKENSISGSGASEGAPYSWEKSQNHLIRYNKPSDFKQGSRFKISLTNSRREIIYTDEQIVPQNFENLGFTEPVTYSLNLVVNPISEIVIDQTYYMAISFIQPDGKEILISQKYIKAITSQGITSGAVEVKCGPADKGPEGMKGKSGLCIPKFNCAEGKDLSDYISQEDYDCVEKDKTCCIV